MNRGGVVYHTIAKNINAPSNMLSEYVIPPLEMLAEQYT